MVQIWPFLRLYTKSKVQGVLNKPHYKERKMNTEFWISNTTTCSDLISPSPILISASLPRLTRGGECRQVSIYRTHLIGLNTTGLCHYSTSDWTTSVWTDDVFLYLPENGISHFFLSIFFSSQWTLYVTSFSEIAVWFHGEGIRRPMSLMHVECLGFVSPGP